MQINDDDSRPAELATVSLAWAVDDRDAPTELTIFDPENETTTRWLTIDDEYVHDLDDTA